MAKKTEITILECYPKLEITSSSCESKCFTIQLRFDKGQSRSILKQKGLLRSIEVYVYDAEH